MNDIPKAVGPYSSHRVINQLLITSGQLPINPKTNTIDGSTVEEQTKQSLLNIQAILKAEGYGFSDVIKTTVYLKDMKDFNVMNQVYANFFKEPFPARTAFEVGKLPMDALVEIEVIASK